MIKNFILFALFLFLVGPMVFAEPLKDRPGGTFTQALTNSIYLETAQAGPASAITTPDATGMSILTASFFALAVPLYLPTRRRSKSPLLRMRSSSLANLMSTIYCKLKAKLRTAWRTKSSLLKSQGSRELLMTA